MVTILKTSNYAYSTTVKNNHLLRESFNKLTQKTFHFDFVSWYELGYWGEAYIPHAILDGNKVISNISVNLMQFDICGKEKKYIQLGTVMTDIAYRKQGLNGNLMEQILKEYKNKVDGIYLFANDSVLNYYPKFGFKPSKEYEYYMPCNNRKNISPYIIKKVDIRQDKQSKRLFNVIKNYSKNPDNLNQNDGMYMSHNLGLYQFWMSGEFENNIYYLPEEEIYIVANIEEQLLYIHQLFGKQQVAIDRLAKSFGEYINEVVLGYTPVDKNVLLVREHKKEDCTLFILGEDLQRIEKNKMIFPILSHA